MFNFNQRLHEIHGVVLAESQELTAEQKQRDVYEAHRHRIFSVSYYMTANEVEAECILAATFIQAFSMNSQPDAQDVDEALLAQLEQRFLLAPTVAAMPDRGIALQHGQVRRTDLEEAVAVLPARERLVFLLHDVEGYFLGKVGALLGSDEHEVQKTLISARIRMRNALCILRMRNTVPQQKSDMTQDIAVGF